LTIIIIIIIIIIVRVASVRDSTCTADGHLMYMLIRD